VDVPHHHAVCLNEISVVRVVDSRPIPYCPIEIGTPAELESVET